MTACEVQTIGDNALQAVIYMSEIMPFHKPDHAYTVNSASRGYTTAESRYDSYVYYLVFTISGKIPCALYIDLSKAFDTLSFDIIIGKLHHYGVADVELRLLISYLTNRKQYVVYNNHESDITEIKAGVPQGSILGPLFFSILINDLINISSKLRFLMYADDTTIYFNLENFTQQNLNN